MIEAPSYPMAPRGLFHMTFIDVLVTCPDPVSAAAIARACVEERLAGCASYGAEVTSVYRWKGVIETTEEITLTLKSRAGLFEKLSERIRALHPYEVPCIVASAMASAAPAYAAWLEAEMD
jgi:periplasmic divalent cation tolerance protein